MSMVGNIVNLTGRRKARSDPAREAVDRHWNAIRRDDGVPLRDDIDPARMLDALDRLILIERIAPRQARIRIAGQRVNDLLGMDLRGMPLSCLIVPPARSWLGDCVETVFDMPAQVDLGLAAPRGVLRERVSAELVMLPLRDRSGLVSRALCYLDLPYRTPGAPLRMEISGERRTPVGTIARTGSDREGTPDRDPGYVRADRAREAAHRRQSLRVVE